VPIVIGKSFIKVNIQAQNRIAPARMPHKGVIDLRIVNPESFIKPTDMVYEPKILQEKGWKEITPNNQ
jgi:hypothetical protein